MTFYFYDLETSGINPKWQRIMQFGGMRTDEDFNPIGEPYQTLVKLTDDVLPEPDAVMITGITPQKSIQEGISEAALAVHLQKEIFTDDTIALGYNSIRFDDEFVRYLFYRNYYDPYLREWSDGRSRWDIIDLVRMTRALRPDGIEWPFTKDGKATNRLEDMTKANKVEHSNAHDAMADVEATVAITRLIKQAQPKLFNHLLAMRDKKAVAQLVFAGADQPVVHTSGRLSSDNLKTSVFMPLANHPKNSNAVICWDLRHDPAKWKNLDARELSRLIFSPWQELAKSDEQRLPVKAIHINKSPAVAPLGVLDEPSQGRINLTLAQIETHLKSLKQMADLPEKLVNAWKNEDFPPNEDVDGMLYDGFIGDGDKQKMLEIHQMSEDELRQFHPSFGDDRLNQLWIRYKARNFAATLTDEERAMWEQFRAKRLKSGPGTTLTSYMSRLASLAQENQSNKDKMYLLEELQLYAESIVPFENDTLFS